MTAKPLHITLVEAGWRFGGISAEALKRRIKRYNSRPGNEPVRLIPGYVNLQDFERWVADISDRR